VTPPIFDDDPGLLESAGKLTVEKFIPKLASVTPIDRFTQATGLVCELRITYAMWVSRKHTT
jgi:hypothetical protein